MTGFPGTIRALHGWLWTSNSKFSAIYKRLMATLTGAYWPDATIYGSLHVPSLTGLTNRPHTGSSITTGLGAARSKGGTNRGFLKKRLLNFARKILSIPFKNMRLTHKETENG